MLLSYFTKLKSRRYILMSCYYYFTSILKLTPHFEPIRLKVGPSKRIISTGPTETDRIEGSPVRSVLKTGHFGFVDWTETDLTEHIRSQSWFLAISVSALVGPVHSSTNDQP